MTRRIKVTSLALIAVAAIGAASAAPVQAFEMHVTTPGSAAIVAQQTVQFVLTTTAGTVTCTTATFEGTAQNNGPSQTQVTNQETTLTPTLAGCTAFGQAAQVLMNGCKFTLTNKSAAGHTTEKTAYVDVAGCTSGKQIEAKSALCTITVPEQLNISHVVFENKSEPEFTPHHVLAKVTLTGIKYENHGALCPFYGGKNTEVRTDGSTNGQATVQTRVDAGTEQVVLHSHQYNRLKQQGALVGIIAT